MDYIWTTSRVKFSQVIILLHFRERHIAAFLWWISSDLSLWATRSGGSPRHTSSPNTQRRYLWLFKRNCELQPFQNYLNAKNWSIDDINLLTQNQQTWADRCRGAELRLPDQDASSTCWVPGHRWRLEQPAHHLRGQICGVSSNR